MHCNFILFKQKIFYKNIKLKNLLKFFLKKKLI